MKSETALAWSERGQLRMPVEYSQCRSGCFFVLGMHRSGTSALTRVINLLGVTLSSKLLPANDGNPTGYWESERAYDLDERCLREALSSWLDWTPLEFPSSAPRDRLIRDASEYLRAEFAETPLFALKDPRFCRLFPEWAEALATVGVAPNVVILLRNPKEIAKSLRSRDGMRIEMAYFLWLRYLLDAERATRGLPRAIVAYEDLLRDWRAVVAAIDGLPAPSEATALDIDAFLCADLKRHHADIDALNADAAAHPLVKDAYRLLLSLQRGEATAETERELDAIAAQFDAVGCAARPYVASIVELQKQLALSRHERGLMQLDLARSAASGENDLRRLQTAHAKLRRDFEALRLARDAANAAHDAMAGDLAQSRTALERLRAETAHMRAAAVEARGVQAVAEFRIERRLQQLNKQRIEAQEAERLALEEQKAKLAALDETMRAATTRGRSVLRRIMAGATTPPLPRDRVSELVKTLRESQLFDAGWYASEYPEVLAANVDPLEHYVMVGGFDDYDPNPYFLNRWYRAANPDIAADENPLAHFIARGRGKKAFPNPFFDVDFYLEANPDVSDSDVEPLRHYIEYGAAEGRSVNALLDLGEYARAEQLENGKDALRHLLRVTLPNSSDLPGKPGEAVRVLRASQLFDRKLYQRSAPEACLFPLDPTYDHHLRGWRLGKSALVLFDAVFYLARNPDVAAARIDPLLHFIEHGAREERAPHPLFDITYYCARYPDIRDSGINPLLHYLRHGWKPNYLPNAFFDSAWYLKSYCSGVARVNPLIDYVQSGKAAGRRPHPDFDPAYYLSANPDIAEPAAADPYAFFVTEGQVAGARNRAGQAAGAPAGGAESGDRAAVGVLAGAAMGAENSAAGVAQA